MAGSAIQSLPLTEEAISARLERLPLTSWYRRIMLIVGMAGFFDAFDALTIAFVLPVLIPLWHIEPGRIGALISIGYIGQLIGALGLSWMAERFGRLSVLRWSIAIYALFNLACAFAWSYDSLFWLRFVQGLGLGAEVPIAATYMNEFTRAELRGRLVLLFQAIFAFGVMITALVAIWVVPNLGWQWMLSSARYPRCWRWGFVASSPNLHGGWRRTAAFRKPTRRWPASKIPSSRTAFSRFRRCRAKFQASSRRRRIGGTYSAVTICAER
jgi:MFS family permease